MPKGDLLWECPLRTQAKLEILSKYLGAWFGILAKKKFKHVYYIDGFCGPGKYLGGEDGSPTIAARLANSTAQKFPDFKASLIFVDKQHDALEHLRTIDPIKNPHSNVNINIIEGIFADQIDDIIATLRQMPLSPTFSFIDPFGFKDSPLIKIKGLMHNDRSEIFINFMCGFMNRFKEHESEEIRNQIMGMIGHDSLDEIINDVDPINKFCQIYEQKLNDIAPYTLKFMMRDETNIRDNCFFFCGNNSRGFEKIKEAMWKVDPICGNSFSAYDETNRELQGELFTSPTPHTRALSYIIMDTFKGKKDVPVNEILKWVIENTDTFLPKHARVELENLNDSGMIESIYDPNPNPRKRKRNTWPGRLLISFTDQEYK